MVNVFGLDPKDSSSILDSPVWPGGRIGEVAALSRQRLRVQIPSRLRHSTQSAKGSVSKTDRPETASGIDTYLWRNYAACPGSEETALNTVGRKRLAGANPVRCA